MYDVSTQGIDEHMVNVHDYYLLKKYVKAFLCLLVHSEGASLSPDK